MIGPYVHTPGLAEYVRPMNLGTTSLTASFPSLQPENSWRNLTQTGPASSTVDRVRISKQNKRVENDVGKAPAGKSGGSEVSAEASAVQLGQAFPCQGDHTFLWSSLTTISEAILDDFSVANLRTFGKLTLSSGDLNPFAQLWVVL